MRTSWEKLVQHVGTKYGQDIINELNRKVKVNLVTQVHLTEVLVRHAIREALVRTGKYNIKEYCRAQGITLREAATADPSYTELPKKIEMLYNEISKGDYDLAAKIPIDMSESEKTAYGNECRTYQERNTNLEKHRGQVYSLILGKFTQLLQDKMK